MDHLVIPDVQIRPGLGPNQLVHIKALANYILELQPQKIICLGDWWDMPSLSKYDLPGSVASEGRRIERDIEAGNDVMRGFMNRIKARNYNPEMHFLMGNHEERLLRLSKEDVRFEGVFDDAFDLNGWKVHNFLDIVKIDGIRYSHYFTNDFTGKPLGGAALTQLKNLGFSFTAGHKQCLDIARLERKAGGVHQGLVAGAFYLHNEHYKVQSNNHWRGVVHKRHVRKGTYDLETIHIKNLIKDFS